MNGKRLKYKGFRMQKLAILVIPLLLFFGVEMVVAEVPSDIQQAYDSKNYDDAIQKIEQALKRDKRNEQLYYILGLSYLGKHDTTSAMEAIDNAVRFDSKFHNARYLLGKLYLETGKLDKARNAFEDGLDKAKDKKDKALFEDGLGLYYLQSGDTTRADIEVRKAQIDDPDNMTYIMHQGDIAFAQGIYSVALNAYKKALASDSLNPEVHFRIAKSYLNQRQFREALSSIERALELDSSYLEGYIIGGDIYTLYGVQQADNPEAQQSLMSNAIFYYTKYLEMSGDSGRANYYRGKAYFTFNDFEKALADFETALEQGYEKEDIFSLIGRSYSGLKQYNKAIEFLDQYEKSILQADPNYEWTASDVSLFLERAKAKAGIGDSASRLEARQDFEKAIELDSTDAMSYYWAGLNEYYLKAYERAVDYLKKHLELYPENLSAYINIAYAYLALQDWNNALLYLNEVIERDSTFVDTYKLKANVFFQKEEYDSAIVYYKKWKEMEPELCEPDRWIGLIYLIKNDADPQSCIRHLKQYQNCLRAKGENVCSDNDVNVWIMKAYQMANDANNAFEWAGKCLKCDPANEECQKAREELEFEIDL
ncbi:MAG TPA: tetratricopeptide repeat protein [candidate division Zixibacteria bacterium]|nr:tetratricopeptide repeat protein [candidate division Zixibacteria bacterium]